MPKLIPDSKLIQYLPEEKAVELRPEATFLELALKHRIPISHTCDGMGTCGTCLIRFDQGAENLEPRNEIEQEMADMRDLPANERLACQTTCFAPATVTVLNTDPVDD